MKKILVTGATGFIGNYVIDELLKKNYKVVATSLSPEKARSSKWYDKVKYISFDLQTVTEQENYYTFFDRPDILIHLAWEGLPNYKSDFHLEKNLPRHYTFIKNLVQHGLKDISVTGTCFEYGMQEGCLSENMPSLPANSYALAKNNLRLLLNELAKTYPFELKWIRLFYLYGKGQGPNSLLSQLQSALDRGDKVFNMSPGDQLRDYLSVEKAAEYIVKIATQNKINGIINCCSNMPVSVKEFVEEYLAKKRATIQLNTKHYPYPDFEPFAFWGDDKKLKKIIQGN